MSLQRVRWIVVFIQVKRFFEFYFFLCKNSVNLFMFAYKKIILLCSPLSPNPHMLQLLSSSSSTHTLCSYVSSIVVITFATFHPIYRKYFSIIQNVAEYTTFSVYANGWRCKCTRCSSFIK